MERRSRLVLPALTGADAHASGTTRPRVVREMQEGAWAVRHGPSRAKVRSDFGARRQRMPRCFLLIPSIPRRFTKRREAVLLRKPGSSRSNV